MPPHSVQTLLRGLSRRTPFSKLESFNHGGLFVGRFSGAAPWERHRHGDELVHVLGGEVTVTLLSATPTPRDVSFSDDPRSATRAAGRAVRKRAGSRRRRPAARRSA